MNSDLARTFRSHSRPLAFLASLTAGLLLGPASTALAGIIVDSVRYDGHVRSGSVTGVEEHLTTESFPPPNTMHPLPATGGPLPAGLSAANNLHINFDQVGTASLNGQFMPRATFWISTMGGIDLFANDLDTTLGFPPVEFETYLFLDDLLDGEMMVVRHVGIEGGTVIGTPWDDPASTTISGLGSQLDPLRIQLGLAADQVQLNNRNGHVKIHLYYDRAPVPEPATLALLGIGAVGAAGLISRHRRRR